MFNLYNFRISLDLKRYEDKLLIESCIRAKKIPNICGLSIVNVESKNKNVKIFLSLVPWHELEEFEFEGGHYDKDKNELWKVSYYSRELEEILRSTNTWVRFWHCIMHLFFKLIYFMNNN